VANDWRGYRSLALGGRQFRWACCFNHPLEVFSVGYVKRGASWPPDRLLVRSEDGAHRLLTVRWPACRGPVVKPALVRACVEEALRRGWLDTHAVLDLAGEEVPLPEARHAF
jgi:hypothetical protein